MRAMAGELVAQLLDQDRLRLHLGQKPRREGPQFLGVFGQGGISSSMGEVYRMDSLRESSPRTPTRLSRASGLPSPLRHPPVDALEQHRQLCRRQGHLALLRRGPDEPPPLQPLDEQAGALTVPPDHLHQIAPPATEDEEMPGERVLLQRRLGLRRQRREARAACPSPRPPARPSCCSGPGSRRKPPEQPGQRLGIVAADDPHPVPAGQLDLDPSSRRARTPQRSSGAPDDLDRKESAATSPPLIRKSRIAQPREDEIGVHVVAPRNLADRDTRQPRLPADHPLLVGRPGPPLLLLRHRKPIVSIIPWWTLSPKPPLRQGGQPGRLR